MSTDKMSIEEQQEFYDHRWQGFDFANALQLQRSAAILDALSRMRLTKPRLLDIGCGAGWLTSILGHFGPTLGVDLSADAIAAASRTYSHARFQCVDIQQWQTPAEAFDVVVSHEVIEHVEDQQGHLLTIQRLLRSNGYLILTTPNARTFAAMTPLQRDSWSNQPIENWLCRVDLKRLLATTGFRIIALRTLVPGFGARDVYRLVNSAKLRAAAERLGLAGRLDALSLRAGLGLHLMAVAQKSP